MTRLPVPRFPISSVKKRRINAERFTKKEETMNAYENLANAIIVQACKDYRDELSCLVMNPPVTEDDRENDEYIKHQTEKGAIEAFFRSQWFHVLSDLDGEYLIRKIQEEPNDK